MAKVRKTNRTRPAPKTAFKKGHAKVGGRKKGTPNKFSGELKQIVLNALENARAHGQGRQGAQEYLTHQAKANPKTFLTLIAKLLPTALTGKDDGPIEVKVQQAQAKLSALNDTEFKALAKLLEKAGLLALITGDGQ